MRLKGRKLIKEKMLELAMAQWFRAPAALAEAPGLFPSIHTAAHNSI